MELPYYILLILYAVGILFGIFFFAVNLYHLLHFGLLDFTARTQVIMTAGVIVVVIVFSVIFLWHINWTESVNLMPNLSVNIL